MNKKQLTEGVPFSITREDYENSSKNPYDMYNCPFAIAAKKFLGIKILNVGNFSVNHGEDRWEIDDYFNADRFKELSEGKEFHTIIRKIF